MHALDVLGDPVRRRILELLAEGELSSGAICAVVQEEFGISQPAVSQHLRVLRDSGLSTVRPSGTRRLYTVNSGPLQEVDAWLGRFRRFWTPHLDVTHQISAVQRRVGGGSSRSRASSSPAAATSSKATPAAR